MKNLKIYLVMMLLACTTMSFAQDDTTPWKGFRLAYDHTFISFDGDDWDTLKDKANGFSISYVHAFNIIQQMPLFIETGIGLNFARMKYTESELNGIHEISFDEKETTKMLGLTIPANLVYKVQLNEKLALKPYTGFYLRINLISKSKNEYTESVNGESEKEVLTWSNFDKKAVGNDVWNRAQFGWQIGTTLDVDNYNVGIGYAIDFNEIAEKTKFGIFSIRLGYNF